MGKRKHASVAESSEPSTSQQPPSSSSRSISFTVSDDNNRDGLKPLLVSTPSIALPREAALTLYTDGKGKGKGSSMLHGESGKLEWSSSNRLKGGSLSTAATLQEEEGALLGGASAGPVPVVDDEPDGESYANYALALYDPSTKSVSLISTPLHILSHIPKRLKALPAIVSDNPSANANSNAAARAELGLSFGTKKSIRAIRAAERNKVDAGSKDLQMVQDVVMENLDEGLETLPAAQPGSTSTSANTNGTANSGAGAQSQADEAYAILMEKQGRPKPHVHAAQPLDVYKIFGEIIFDKEFDSINPTALLQFTSSEKEKAISMLPFRRSEYLNDRMKECLALKGEMKEGTRKRRMKVIIWCSAMMALKGTKGGVDPGNAETLRKKFGGGAGGFIVPADCMVSLLDRFAENVRGTKSRSVTSASEVRLITHLFTACLWLDSYINTDVNLLANDLAITGKKANDYFKSLGCRVIAPRSAELERVLATWRNEGRTASLKEDHKVRVASLRVPLEFPRERKGAPKR